MLGNAICDVWDTKLPYEHHVHVPLSLSSTDRAMANRTSLTLHVRAMEAA